MKDQFTGFSHRTLEFLTNLGKNNYRDWFKAHKQDYIDYVLEPFQLLVAELSTFILNIDTRLDTFPAVDRTISRIYRDTRFSKDKSPFRTNVWIAFKYLEGDWKKHPTFFFELFPDYYRYGMGYYKAPRTIMTAFRENIDEAPRRFLNIVKKIPLAGFELRGEDYKKLYQAHHIPEIQMWYGKKSFYLCKDCPIDDTLFSNKLPRQLKNDFKVLIPLYNFLKEIHSRI